MEIREKLIYEAPSSEIIEVAQQSVVCASGNTEKFVSGNSYDDNDFE